MEAVATVSTASGAASAPASPAPAASALEQDDAKRAADDLVAAAFDNPKVPAARTATSPVTAEAEAEPVVAEPVAEVEAEPVAEAEAVVPEAEPVVAEAEPEVAEEPEPVVAEEPEPVVAEEPEPVVAEEPEPVVAEVEPEPVVAEVEPEPVVAEAEPEPVVAEAEPEPVVAEAEPEVAAEPEPVVAETEPEPEPEPVVAETEPEPEPVVAEPEPEPEPVVAEAEPEAAAEPTPAPEPAPAAVPAATPSPLADAPQLGEAYAAAEEVLKERGLIDARAAVYLVVDRSGSMRGYFKDGSVQRIAEQTVALAAHLTEDAAVTAVFFSTDIDGTAELRPAGIDGRIDEINAGLGRLGRTNYHRAVEEVLAHHEKADPTRPALVVFQTDGAPESKTAATQALAEAAERPIHWQFVAWGEEDNKAFDFVRKLTAPRTGHYLAGATPSETAHADFYRGLLSTWEA
ncbi:VWA domain-containing protein [Streptomyces sp. NPDC050848]|uniref:VWA domain-containing protein n=1 Tax=Streptomyces sp. NPDC050848 TaxID=3155791 RepID=UPI0033CF31DF